MMKREFCPRCAIKHLAQARVLLREREKGYPHFVWNAIGHMAEAEDEIVERMPTEALLIRNERTRLDKDLRASIDFKSLMYAVAKGGMLEEVAGMEDIKEEETANG